MMAGLQVCRYKYGVIVGGGGGSLKLQTPQFLSMLLPNLETCMFPGFYTVNGVLFGVWNNP